MFWTVYKTTHLESGKVYIGVHKTLKPNDRYLGSGKLISRAIKKHGRQAFAKEVLFTFDNPGEAYAKEAELVRDAFVKRADSYNLAEGGGGNRYGSPGEKNSQWGSMWVHRGSEQKKLPRGEPPEGWSVGRGSGSMPPPASWSKGRVHVHRDGADRFILQEHLEDAERGGWKTGMSETFRLSISRGTTGSGQRPPSPKGSVWVNNGTQEFSGAQDSKKILDLLALGYEVGRVPLRWMTSPEGSIVRVRESEVNRLLESGWRIGRRLRSSVAE